MRFLIATSALAGGAFGATCDSYCQNLNGTGDYCKSWSTEPTCQIGGQSCRVCALSDAISGTSTAKAATTQKATTKASTTKASTTKASTTKASTTKAPTTQPAATRKTSTKAATQGATAVSCDAHCRSLNGESDYCMSWADVPVCHAGHQDCGPSKCGASAATAAPTVAATTAPPAAPTNPSTSSTTKTTTSKVVSTTPAATAAPSDGSCESMPAKSAAVSIWVEWPSLSSRAEVQRFYQRLLAYLTGNCANIRPSKVIVRVMYPSFPLGSGEDYFKPATSTPLFSELLRKLPSSIALHFYPYVMDALDKEQWTEYSNGAGVMNGVFKLVDDWNSFLADKGVATRVKGVVIDNEEIGRSTILDSVADLKGSLEFGLSIGFDQTGKLNGYDYVDQFYMQAYDFYYPSVATNRTSNSLFLLNKNDPAAMVDYVNNVAILANQWNAYAIHSSRITLMWSNQSLGSDCLYPLGNGTCGANNEFGTWSPSAFNAFLQELQESNPIAASMEHALFQFSFTHESWMPSNFRS